MEQTETEKTMRTMFDLLAPALREQETGSPDFEGRDSTAFEQAYFDRYGEQLSEDHTVNHWTIRALCTAHGNYQILGENLARYEDMNEEDLEDFYCDDDLQFQIAKRHFYRTWRANVKQHGWKAMFHILSMWNGGTRFVKTYDTQMRQILERMY
jgi:hypothetical protein